MRMILSLALLMAVAGYHGLEAQGHKGTTDEYNDYKGWVSCGCHKAPSCRQCGYQPFMCNGDCTWNWSGCILKGLTTSPTLASTTSIPVESTASPIVTESEPVQWSGIQTKVWGDDQCKNLGNFGNLNFGLEDCKKKCLATATCTAINYNKVTKDCVLRGCTQPVQPPQWQDGDYRGYYIMDQMEITTTITTSPITSTPTGTFHSCVGSWCRQSGTSEQFTRCESVRDGGLTCVNPEIRYGSTEDGVPCNYRKNDYDAWCQQVLGFGANSKATFGKRDCTPPKGRLFWGPGWDEPGFKWCDSIGGFWKNSTLDAPYRCTSDGITSLTCSK